MYVYHILINIIGRHYLDYDRIDNFENDDDNDYSNGRHYPVVYGEENMKKILKADFPDEEEAIDKYFGYVEATGGSTDVFHGLLKVHKMNK